MRFFWIFFGVLVAATVAVFLLGDPPEAQPAGTETLREARLAPSQPRDERPGVTLETPTEIATPAEPQALSAMPWTPEDPAPHGGAGVVVESSVVDGLEPADATRVESPAPEAAPVIETVEAVELVDAKPESVQIESVVDDSVQTAAETAPAPEVVEETPTETVVSSDPAPEPAPVVTPPAAPPASTNAANGPVRETDTGLLLAGRWAVPGRGTREMPYVLSWEMLVAVQREYEPRLGKDKVPEWLEALQGKRVSIEGYVLLPIGGGSMSELLVMQNQWDGCCIGLPPTPYDAVEVRLGTRLAPNADQIFAQGGSVAYGRIKGLFEIDPYIAQGWLLGLYLINDAEATLFGPAGSP